ncbi:uncharacterized protein LOC114391790 isoform X1 [Glycine soja]|uniref:uncharacterized protein LOC114391790 isoform X1 n=1 Tax=Glycine soja TaxID=3848 RepID=UPI00103C7C77|nr:uncharacterized protein LOC114391790 isoform X1 [Glycine soja]XP_028208548.1 uncharacterized protein LOC114391790 isoform X1 [Glycine soja]XP_028208549.1 uncharacterized protein LOC114391790 isoform X1 [Glycine soja]XP_028208551.1 uncharacterized protein LOC114391790 isoform X1 [Glycine soja]XP_028208552.1 uncharacterized protein LOC114391790 isoform X1 [Glycine soja]XP_028208553.1 uncharacterized protein LOC114391790 isoform X1 [Glycine soja]XP_028208554.1 uncharacterized protein LOC11439
MESAWKRKCDSPFQPSTSAAVPSAPVPEPEPEINTSHCLYPQFPHGLRSKFVGGKQCPVYQSFPHSITHGSGQADTGSSFLSLLYAPPSLLQHESWDLSNHKLCISSCDCTAAIGNSVVGSIESGTFRTSGVGLMTENLINRNLQSWVTTFPEISSRAMVGLKNSSNFVFHDIQSSNTATQPTIPGGEKARESFSSSGQCQGTSPACSLNVCWSDVQTTPTVALEQSSSKYATPFMSGCPRVFCMGKSGHLLLSNTGLLGIVCSCHCCHMSVVKFCEHSGLYGVDPGEAVRMESGETISQWQKQYFLKFGIRSLGNENEWDWPEVLSTTGSLMRSNASAFDMSKTNLSHMLSSSAVMSRSAKSSDYAVFPKNAHADNNLFIDALSSKQATTIQDGCNIPLKGFTGISQNSLYDQLKNQLTVSNLAMYTTAPNFVGTQLDDGCQPIPPFFDSQKRKGNLSSAHSPLQIPTSLLKDHDCIKKKNANDGLVGKDAASSNIDLRLGQPPQTGNLLPSFAEPLLFNALASPPKSQPLKQMINNADLSREEELQNNFSYAAGSIKMVQEMPQLKLNNYMSAVGNASARARSETKNVAEGLSFSPFLQFDNQSGGKTKASENLWNDESSIMPKKLYSDYGHTGRQSNNSGIRTNKSLNNDKGVNFAKDSGVKINSGFGIGQLMEYPSSIKRAVSASDILVVNGKIHESSLPSDTSVCADILHGSNNVSFLGQENHTPQTSIPFKGILKGLPHHVSSSVSNQTPILPQQQQGINMDAYLLDENMRLLALSQILELSKQQHALYLKYINQKQGRSSCISKVQHYRCEASTSEQGTSGATLKLSQNRGIWGNHESTVGLEKLASLTGMNGYCHLSGLPPIPLHSKEKESRCNESYDLQNEDTSLSLGINKDNTRSGACEKCSEQPSNICLGGKYSCAAQTNCCRSNFFSGIEPLCYNLKQKLGNASGETSLKMASDLSRDVDTSKGKNILIEQGGKLDGQDSIKIGFHTPQWRDVPSKVRKAVCDATSLDQTATGLDWEGQDGVQLGNISMKRFKRTIGMGDISKEQKSSNVSSGCSAPVVTQASVEVNKIDSCTDDAVDTGFVNNLVVDEGSGIDQGWSSDLVERSDEFLGSTTGSCLKNDYLRVLYDQPCCNLLDDLKLLDSLIWKKGRNQNHFVLSSNCKTNQSQKVKKVLKGKKRKRNVVRIVDASSSLLHKKNEEGAGICNSSSSLSREMQMHSLSSLKKSSNKSSFVQPSNKQKHTAYSSKFLSCKNRLNKHQSFKVGYESESSSDAEFHTLPGVSGTKKLEKDLSSDCFEQFQMQELAYEEPENDKLRPFSCRKENAHRITRPVVVCGKYGEISNGHLAREVQKPAKIVSLSKVLKSSKRCMGHTNGKPRLTSKKKWKRLSIETSSGHCCRNPGLKIKEHNETENTIFLNETNVDVSMEDLERGGKPPAVYKGKRDAKAKQGDSVGNRANISLKVKNKEIRKQRSINELTAKETKVMDMTKCAQDQEPGLCGTKSRNSIQGHTSISTINSDAFCCVCRRSTNDKINCLLECSRCLIRVHQACYGVSTLPKKSSWCCRPCRTNSKNIVYPACVLCGYGGGAMTRAIMSHTIVKSLLKVWNCEKDGMPRDTTSCEVLEKEIDAFPSSKDGLEVDQESVLKPKIVDTSTDLMNQISTNHIPHTPTSFSNFKVHNSITEGVLDPTVKQWIHMVCGLWTPRTRCPNVDTMSAFDVSGVSRPRADVVCSICNRWGGSCIECRIADCSVKFHPWCAHQKNLLQSETEGINDEKIGFYGRCMLHTIEPRCLFIYDPLDEIGSQEQKEFTCARVEGYKGRRWDGFQNNQCQGGCLVPEEQLNAWIHINGQKLCSQGLPKFPDLDIEHDCRKEYARYKQAKGWKHLVVYKSRIHALGLYTSRFISRGEMVVEYIGEIVGLRVADKREKEYQSGRKLQYKSACYFFRIDKEHIIDATRKGGIARFVNHSCLPNCVAKVITVRHEKKVVFLAERDIFPGEEITYDYHFNHEDEGKIPCYCYSKNCRRYMN